MEQTIEVTKDLVSIIIPYYKKKKYILKTINSILNQSYNYFEIIIIYDDENISDLGYLEEAFKSYKKIKFIAYNYSAIVKINITNYNYYDLYWN